MREPLFLIVEDDKVNSVYLRHLLFQMGIRSQTAPTGFDAIEKFKFSDNKFDYILMDIHLPDTTGIEITKEMRAHEIMREVKKEERSVIIGMSTFMNESLAQECVASGMQEAFPKPLTKEHISQILKQYTKQAVGYDSEKNIQRNFFEAVFGLKII